MTFMHSKIESIHWNIYQIGMFWSAHSDKEKWVVMFSGVSLLIRKDNVLVARETFAARLSGKNILYKRLISLEDNYFLI